MPTAGANLRLDTVLRAGIPFDTSAEETTAELLSGTYTTLQAGSGRLDILLSGGMEMKGGNITATSTGPANSVLASSRALVAGKDVYICHPTGCDIGPVTYTPGNTITMRAGNATATNILGGSSVANSEALIKGSDFLRIVVGGDIYLVGGSSDRVGSGIPISRARIDPVSELIIRTGGSVVLQSGAASGGATESGARIENEGNITMFIGGGTAGNLARYTYNDPVLGATTLGPGLILIGNGGSGVFDANNRSLTGTGIPITLIFGNGGIVRHTPSSGTFGSSIVRTGVNSFDDSLLRFILFSQLEAAKADRIRRGITDDDLGGAACQ